MLDPGRVARGPPPALVVLGQLKVVALAVHPSGHAPDTSPRVEPGPERPESVVVRGTWEPSEPDCCSRELAALVEHGLFDQLIRPPEHRRRDREAERLGGLH